MEQEEIILSVTNQFGEIVFITDRHIKAIKTMPVIVFDTLISNISFHNFTDYIPNHFERDIIIQGLTFTPTPTHNLNIEKVLQNSFEELTRRLEIRFQFHGSTLEPSIYQFLHLPNLTWIPERASDDLYHFLHKTQTQAEASAKALSVTPVRKTNYAKKAMFSFKKLCASNDIFITPSDKKCGITIVPESWRIRDAFSHLYSSTYTEISFDDIIARLNTYNRTVISKNFSNSLKNCFNLSPKQITNFKTLTFRSLNRAKKGKIPKFKNIPKVHKMGKKLILEQLKSRPLIGAFDAVTSTLSKIVDDFLQSTFEYRPWILTDSLSLVKDLLSMTVSPDTYILTFDITSLYPSIPITEGIERVVAYLIRMDMPTPTANFVGFCLSLILNNSYCTFNKLFFHQLIGTAMGVHVAPIFAILFLISLEDPCMYKSPLAITHLDLPDIYYKRYLDDGFALGTIKELVSFVTAYRSFHPNIRIEDDAFSIQKAVNFMDLSIFIRDDGTFGTSTYHKPFNLYLYTPHNSAIPNHVKTAFISGRLIDYVRKNSTYDLYNRERLRFFGHLLTRGFRHVDLLKEFVKISYANRLDYLKTVNKTKSAKGSVIILPYHPHILSLNLSTHLRNNWENLTDSTKAFIGPPPMIAWRKAKKIEDIINIICAKKGSPNNPIN